MSDATIRLCAVSVDIDEIPNYYGLHGLAAPRGSDATVVYDKALPRLAQLASSLDIPMTWFAVARDVVEPRHASWLKAQVEHGDEIANHSMDHRYDMCLMCAKDLKEQIGEAADLIEHHVGVRPRGFRSPGYVLTDAMVDVLRECGVMYDTSVFPSVAYYGAKAAVVVSMALRGRRSRSIVDHPRVLTAPTRPYRLGRPYTTKGDGPVEIPVQVTRWARLPYIGTSLTLAGANKARWLTRMVVGEPVVNLELHGIDALDASDGLEPLRAVQPDVRIAWQDKLETLSQSLQELRRAGYSFVRLDEAAQRYQ